MASSEVSFENCMLLDQIFHTRKWEDLFSIKRIPRDMWKSKNEDKSYEICPGRGDTSVLAGEGGGYPNLVHCYPSSTGQDRGMAPGLDKGIPLEQDWEYPSLPPPPHRTRTVVRRGLYASCVHILVPRHHSRLFHHYLCSSTNHIQE